MRALLISACSVAVTLAAQAAPADLAADILKTSGLQGGLVVHVNCGTGELTAALHAGDRILVQGLDTDAGQVALARRRLADAHLYGPVTINMFDGQRLPFVDNLVDLLIVSGTSQVSDEEVRRVLTPRGTVWFEQAAKPPAGLQPGPTGVAGWRAFTKPVPDTIDEWTHYLRSADNNAVSDDQEIGAPRSLQWLASPIWSRHHDKQASVSAVVTSAGRVFDIVDRGPTFSPSYTARWLVEARDAFNGLLLWQVPMKSWVSHMRGFRSGPVQLARLLVVDGDQVFVALGINEPVSVLDAASGRKLRDLTPSRFAEEIILHKGVLLTVTGIKAAEQAYDKTANFRQKAVVAVSPNDGHLLWRWPKQGHADVVPQTLAADGQSVFLEDGTDTVCLALKDGAERWRTPCFGQVKTDNQKKSRRGGRRSPGWDYATLVVHGDVVLSCDGKTLVALDAGAGRKLWNCPAGTPFGRVPSTDILVINDLVWSSPNLAQGRNVHTGKVAKSLDVLQTVTTAGHHHRCYRNKGVGDFIIYGYRGMDFFDTRGENHSRNNWIRGLCQYGVMPANGLLYAPPNNCGCYPEALLHGFYAVAPARDAGSMAPRSDGRLVTLSTATPAAAAAGAADWPTYRGNAARSGDTGTPLPKTLKPLWRSEVGGRITPPVIAAGTVVLAERDAQTVFALDAGTGKKRWSFVAGGEVDSAPTIHQGRVLFGAANGCVYCLDLADGTPLWRFEARPADVKTVSLGHVESLWPVHGSICVKDNIAYFAAGRSTYLDGGITLFGVDARTGQPKYRHQLAIAPVGRLENTEGTATNRFSQNKVDYKTLAAPDRSDAFSMTGNTSDIMTADADSVYLRHMRFTDQLAPNATLAHHLFSTSKLLDGNQAHRSHWFYGNGDFSRLNVAYEWLTRGSYGGFCAPFGTLLVFDDKTVWGVIGHDAKTELFASDIRNIDARMKKDFPATKAGGKYPEKLWKQSLEVHPRAFLKAGDALYVGGAKSTEALLSGKGGVVLIAAAADGMSVGSLATPAPPVFDGMAAAGGKLFVSLADGSVRCFGQ